MNEISICKSLFENIEEIALEKGAVLVIAREKEPCDFQKLKGALSENGCRFYAEKREGDNLFATYTADGKVINISYTPFEKTVRLIKDNTSSLPPKEVHYDSVTTPLITQLRNPYFNCDCGMSYIIRLTDGRFVIIDGGEGEYDEIEHTMDVLNSQNATDGKITVAAWFITHAHSDHFNGFVQIMDKYGKDIKLERLVYNWSVPSLTCAMSPLGEFNRAVEALTDTEIITARSGQVYSFAGTDFEILYACEDLYPEFIKTLNDTSTVFRMTVNGRRVMWLGDIMGQGSAYITKKYSEEQLKCEILQVGHHGYWGGSQKFHEMMNPETIIWPCPDFWYQEIKDWDCNRFFKESRNIKHKFICGQDEVTIDMTKPVSDNEPYKKDGSVIVEENFDGGSVYGLHMSHITGGSTGYRPVTAEVLDGCMKFTAGNAYSVLELTQPGFMEGEKKVTLQLRGKAGECTEKIGLLYNHPHPTVWSDIKALWLNPEKNTDFDYRLELDFEKCDGVLYDGKKLVKRIRFVKEDAPCGIYLVMKNSEIVLNQLLVKR